ncbi:hypothetical protein [uncultured Mucilaginibacter sp.]|uniref:GAP1-N1 domain-containing protein n=1 Tax=uncultured Mucilaginibacter sp. TaxID=797541 RepID=UPI0025F2AB1C|nr:hypothetical protein [uncultured Mucilaginibacter sp.]
MAEGNIIIQQSLHGYRGGHSLLASSVELTSSEKKELLLLSDLSGSGNETGFTEYYTGYPLSNSKYYAFAKTWYASEMPRPGCVWTHTILIDISILWTLKNIQRLTLFFKRPNLNEFREYTLPLSCQIEDFKRQSKYFNDEFFWLTDELYSNAEKLILLDRSSESLFEAILDLWSFQWPRLKRSFKFCTGSMSPRHLGNEFFDLQVVPTTREKYILKAEKDKYYISSVGKKDFFSHWIREYSNQNLESVEEFMTRYGSDVEGFPKRFLPLFQAFELANNINYSFEDLVSFFALNFTNNEAKSLKAYLIAKLLRERKFSQYTLLNGIISNNIFSSIQWKIDELILNAWQNKQVKDDELNNLLSILYSQEKVSELQYLLKRIPIRIWMYNLNIYRNLLSDLLENLEIDQIKDVWNADILVQDLWWNSISRNKHINFRPIINQMLAAGNGNYAEASLQKYGSEVFNELYFHLYNTSKPVNAQWQYLIKLDPENAFINLSKQKKFNSELFAIVPSTLSPSATFWKNISTKYIVDYLSKVDELPESLIYSENYTFFLSVAFTRSAQDPEELTTVTFERLHQALENNICEQFTWQRFKMIMGNDLYELVEHDFFSKLFKERNDIPDWDRCEFLRRSLVSRFIKFNWDPKLLLRVVKKDYIFKSIVKFGIESKPFKKMLKNLRNYLELSNQTDIIQYKILKKHVS